jgi:hypothetical protein
VAALHFYEDNPASVVHFIGPEVLIAREGMSRFGGKEGDGRKQGDQDGEAIPVRRERDS